MQSVRFLLLSTSLLPMALAVGMKAAEVSSQPYSEIRFEHQKQADPVRQIFVARVDLSDPDVDVRVSPGGPDPDGPGEYQTTLQVPTVIAERERFELAVNGDFFRAQQTVNAEGKKSGYVDGKWAAVKGPAVTDGNLWGPATEARPVIFFDAAKKARIAETKDVPTDALQAMAGSHVIVKDGVNCAPNTDSFAKTQHPRTAAGIADNGKTLVLVVVDGRRPTSAVGMSLTDLADLMKKLGCRDALNLDGGGSSEMVLRDPQNGQLQVVNSPSDGRERAVANVLGVSIRGVKRMPATPK
ncbi:phosphodiester glycosidase family protein [bacterium]|nr:MAG: phosphodiester glycosidase family protein [bacterium]